MGYFLTYKQRQGVVNSNSHKSTNRYAQSTVSSRSRHSSPREQGVTDYRGCFGPPIPPYHKSLSKPGSVSRSRRLAYSNELRRDHPISKLRESNKGIDDEFIKANERVLKATSSNEAFEKCMNNVYRNYDCSGKTKREILTLVINSIVSPYSSC